jgi:hypothetical protein
MGLQQQCRPVDGSLAGSVLRDAVGLVQTVSLA